MSANVGEQMSSISMEEKTTITIMESTVVIEEVVRSRSTSKKVRI